LEAGTDAADRAAELVEQFGWPVHLASLGFVSRLKQSPDQTDFAEARVLADRERVGYLPRVWIAPKAGATCVPASASGRAWPTNPAPSSSRSAPCCASTASAAPTAAGPGPGSIGCNTRPNSPSRPAGFSTSAGAA